MTAPMDGGTGRAVLRSRANEALDGPLDPLEERAMIEAASRKLEELLDVLRIDHRNDHNTRDTPQRVAKMYVQELARGLAVRISAVHMCKTHRGVRAGHESRMVNTAFHGAFLDDPSLRSEFLQESIALARDC